MILTLLIMAFSLSAHWLACIWFVIGANEQPDYTDPQDLLFPGQKHHNGPVYLSPNLPFSAAGWLNLLAQRMSLPNGGCVPHWDAYVTALYYACTSLTTVGFGNVSANTRAEKVFSVVVMIFGGKVLPGF